MLETERSEVESASLTSGRSHSWTSAARMEEVSGDDEGVSEDDAVAGVGD